MKRYATVMRTVATNVEQSSKGREERCDVKKASLANRNVVRFVHEDSECLRMKRTEIRTRKMERLRDIRVDRDLILERVVTERGAEIYLIGEVHMQKKSADLVAEVIECVAPDVVMVELSEIQERYLYKDIGFKHSERTVWKHANIMPGFKVVLGDRLPPIRHLLTFIPKLITSFVFTDKEDFKNIKENTENTWKRLFPANYNAIIDERDVYMSHALVHCVEMVHQGAASDCGEAYKPVVVAKVGAGHVPVMLRNLGE